MSLPLTSLQMSAFTIGGDNLYTLLKTFSVQADNDLVDGRGMGSRYKNNRPVKQSQKVDFSVFMLNNSAVEETNLDVTVWNIGGTGYITTLKRGAINITTETKDGSSIGQAYKIPVAVATDVEVTCDLLIISEANMTNLIISGTEAQMAVALQVTFGGESFAAPMILKSSSYKVDRGEIQMENVSFALQGTPTGPSDGSLMGIALTGSGAVALTADTGGNTYETAGGQYGILTRLNTQFEDGALVEQTGTVEIQGALTVAGA